MLVYQRVRNLWIHNYLSSITIGNSNTAILLSTTDVDILKTNQNS